MSGYTLNLGASEESPLNLVIESRDGRAFSPPVIDGVDITWERVGVPGKLEFTTIKSSGGNMSFWEGDKVTFTYKDKVVFLGYVFTKDRDREHRIKVTCYDQMRYLQNKFSYVFTDTPAEEIVQSLCKDFELQVGEFDKTEYTIPAIAEENSSAFDILLTVNEEVLSNTGKLFVLYDDAGKLYYKDTESLKVNTLIVDYTAENFEYKSSIDEQTYNSVVLYYKPDAQQVASETAGTDGVTQGTITNDKTYVWPTPGFSYITSPFGYRTFDGVNWDFHLGIDIGDGGINGSNVHATKSGTVESAGWLGTYGNQVMIRHADGGYSRYAHLSKIAVSNGQTVSQNQIIGNVGSTGNSTGPHLHFEISVDGVTVTNPSNYVSPSNTMSLKAKTRSKRAIQPRLEKSGYEEEIWAEIRSHGYSVYATAAIMGNMYQESRCNPHSENGSDGGYGLCQWTNTGSGDAARRTNLINWCNANGYDYTTVKGQVAFMDYEFNKPYYQQFLSNFKNSTNVNTAAYEWLLYFEGINDGTLGIRQSSAGTYFSDYSINEPVGAVGPGGGGTASEQSTGSDIQIFHAENEDKIKEWGLLRYFEEVSSPSLGEGKAKELLELYCRKTRTLRVKNAFGDPNVRGGTMIPTILNLGDLVTNNYMLVEKVTHHFSKDYYTMDLDLEGAWED